MKILDIAFKDLTRSFRSAFAVGMMLVVPLLIAGLLYFAFGNTSSGNSTPPAVKVGVVNLDVLPANSPLEEPLGASIRGMFFDESVKSWITASDYRDEASAHAAVDKQQIGVAIIIPKNFTEQYMNGAQDTPIVIINDPTLTVGPGIIKNMVAAFLDGVSGGGIALETIRSRYQANNVQFDPTQIPNWIARYTNWYKEFERNIFHRPDQAALITMTPDTNETQTTGGIQALMGMVMAGQMIFFGFYTGAYSMMSILREDEEGTLARLFTTPTDRTVVLGGKFLTVFLTLIVQALVLMTVAHYAFGVNWGNPASVAMALTGQVVAAGGLGVFLIALVKNTRQAGPVLGGGLTLFGMLGGTFTTSVPNPPAALTALADFTPHGWVLKIWRMAMEGQSASDMVWPLVVLIVMGVVMFVIGALMFKKRYA